MTRAERALAEIAAKREHDTSRVVRMFKALAWGVPLYVVTFVALLMFRCTWGVIALVIGTVAYHVAKLRHDARQNRS